MAFINGPVPEVVERLVTATATAFERDLRAAWPEVGRSVSGALLLACDDLHLTIELEVLPQRRLGLFELPQLKVRYVFQGGDEAARRRWLALLDRSMQKGGG
ncbi:hypothetical protein J5J83_22085 [Azoarcus sp. L1K30]|uniref:hypothetical protein n=1 Tax=Azoarcus sp. L1K30 TaxID=2820277 RepID=UPI001B83DA94|nr:hypothetical protein [Azoarcus sp. L1K30]MBR0568824.1 hypothetical protein [Azoarcus sp. L1K30]